MDGVKDLMSICEKKKVSTNFSPSVGYVQMCNALFLKRDGSASKIVATQSHGSIPRTTPRTQTKLKKKNHKQQTNKKPKIQKAKCTKCSIVAHACNMVLGKQR